MNDIYLVDWGMASKMKMPIAWAIWMGVLLGTEASIGINWGRESAQRLPPSQVVDLLLQNGIGRVRVYTSQADILAALAGSGINVTISLLMPSLIKSKDHARNWVQRIHSFLSPCNVREVYLGGYPFNSNLEDKEYRTSIVRAHEWAHEALKERGFGDVKVNFNHMDSIFKANVTKPSEAEFADQVKPEMVQYLQYLVDNDAPFPVELIPIVVATSSNLDPSFAFPDKKSDVVIEDVNGAVYTNVVEWRYDCYVWALEKMNFSRVRVEFAMIGWPTDGYPGATTANAERFYRHLLPWLLGDKGTPKRPGSPIRANLQALVDEPKLNKFMPPFTRHWGIYRSNGEPKYKIDLTGQGRHIYPTTARGIMLMPSRWCVFNGDRRDMEKVKAQLLKACTGSDCTSTEVGGSCSGLTFDQNVSYAFNMYFQFNFQNEKACNFDGLARVAVTNPSTDQCVFPIEVVKGQQNNFVASNAPPTLTGDATRPTPGPLHSIIPLFLLLCPLLILTMSDQMYISIK